MLTLNNILTTPAIHLPTIVIILIYCLIEEHNHFYIVNIDVEMFLEVIIIIFVVVGVTEVCV